MKKPWLLLVVVVSSTSVSLAQNCIPLTDSTTCPAFNAASVSTSPALTALYPFLAFVSNTQEFDNQLSKYVRTEYVQQKYQNVLGCDNVDLGNTSSLYARYTTSLICNGIVQNSRRPCGTAAGDARPLCADSCAELAISEEKITTSSQLCGNPVANYVDHIRADFTTCALPADSISGACVTGAQNEPDDCGFGSSLEGLCDYCRASSENATDSCCIGSNATGRCQNVVLPQFSLNPNLLPTSTASGASTAPATNTPAAGENRALSRGAIAGIAIGSVMAAALLLAMLAACCIFVMRRRRNRSRSGSVFIPPPPPRNGVQGMQQTQTLLPPNPYEVLPGGRVARMSALQGPSAGDTAPRMSGTASRRGYDTSDSEPYDDSPGSDNKMKGPATGKRDASLSSNSVFPIGQDSSPNSNSNGQYSSPDGVNSGQSEQLAAFKDYYSSGEIHPNDKVSVLWAYQPRAGDEFELERGDMLKVVGIWDDGWATGVRIDDRAEEYDGKHKLQRDSGVSNGSGARAQSPPPSGEIKAFPLVCVCLPEAWKKTVEGDASTESGSGSRHDT